MKTYSFLLAPEHPIVPDEASALDSNQTLILAFAPEGADVRAATRALTDAFPAAHIMGCSMGGMITQLLAIRHPDKVLSITSVMSTTGHPSLPRATPAAQAVLAQKRSDPVSQRDAYLSESVEAAITIGSPAYPEDPDMLRARAAADLDRAFRPSGFARQYAAILASPHRRTELTKLALPALVIHGTDDPLVTIEGGRDTAACIPGCELIEIAGMGHNIPEALYAQISDAIARVAGRAPARV